jgi:hypothetical protein
MKALSSTLQTIAFSGLAVIVSLVGVSPAFAVETETPGATRTEAPTCSRIAILAKTGKEAVSGKRSELQTDFSKRLANVSTKQTEVDQKILDARTAATDKFEEKIKSLQAIEGLTTEQLAAIDTFKTDVEAAQLTRRTAVDDARAAYRTGLATLVASNQQTLSTATTAYQTAITAAFATAIANCTATNVAATLTTLKASIKSARDTLQAQRTPDTKKEAIKVLAATREAAIKSANETFKTTIAGLVVTFKAALPITDDSTSTN